MAIKMKNLAGDVQSLIRGLMLGDVIYVNGDLGSDDSNGLDITHGLKTLNQAVRRTSSGNHDYVLGVGAETLTAAVAISQADLHIIGIGNGGIANEYARGWQLTCAASVDCLQPAATADGLEVAGIQFTQNADDGILVDDAGAVNCFFHHCTIIGSTTVTNAQMLDIEGAGWTINDNIMWDIKLAIDFAAAGCVARRNIISSQDTAAKGVVIGASAHRCIIDGNVFNLGGGTTDIGITLASSADHCVIMNNLFHPDCSDAINDSGTDTLKIGNLTGAIAGATGASILQAIED